MRPRSSDWLARAGRRLRRGATRAGERLRSLPLRWSHRGLPIPPPRLIHLVAGTDDAAWFLAAGRRAADSVRHALERRGLDPARLGAVLDFGCGAGRVLRHWDDLAARGVALHGTDYNPELVAWCRRHLPFARVGLNGLDPGLDHPDAAFDLVYAFSVFTHLTPARQASWMAELRRVLRPGGHLLISLHGGHYRPALDPRDRERFEAGEMVVVRSDREGTNACAAFHPEPYVRRELARGWEVADFVPEGAWGNPNQDVYLLRKPAASSTAAA